MELFKIGRLSLYLNTSMVVASDLIYIPSPFIKSIILFFAGGFRTDSVHPRYGFLNIRSYDHLEWVLNAWKTNPECFSDDEEQFDCIPF